MEENISRSVNDNWTINSAGQRTDAQHVAASAGHKEIFSAKEQKCPSNQKLSFGRNKVLQSSDFKTLPQTIAALIENQQGHTLVACNYLI